MSRCQRVLILVGGGIAAYRTLEVIRLLVTQGSEVRVILTAGGARFVTPLSLATLSRHRVYEDLFDEAMETEIGHIALARWADVILVAPATAHMIAKMASGWADDLATTTLLATDKPILIAPAMNVNMWHHPATQANLACLRERGVLVCGPDSGEMACGEYGEGKMSSPAEIVSCLHTIPMPELLQDWVGKRVLVTAGPTREPIDPVRFLSNRSSGRQGYAIAQAAAQRGAQTILISGPVDLPCPKGVERLCVETAQEMREAVFAALPCDVAFFVAAVSDWRVVVQAPMKIKKGEQGVPPQLTLVETQDILREVAHLPMGKRPQWVVGFAAETNDILENARKKRLQKGCDLMVCNNVSQDEGGVFGRSVNKVSVLSENAEDHWPEESKDKVAARLLSYVLDGLKKECGKVS